MHLARGSPRGARHHLRRGSGSCDTRCAGDGDGVPLGLFGIDGTAVVEAAGGLSRHGERRRRDARWVLVRDRAGQPPRRARLPGRRRPRLRERSNSTSGRARTSPRGTRRRHRDGTVALDRPGCHRHSARRHRARHPAHRRTQRERVGGCARGDPRRLPDIVPVRLSRHRCRLGGGRAATDRVGDARHGRPRRRSGSTSPTISGRWPQPLPARVVPDVSRYAFWTPAAAAVRYLRQVAPVLHDMTDTRFALDERTGSYLTGPWAAESREYHLCTRRTRAGRRVGAAGIASRGHGRWRRGVEVPRSSAVVRGPGPDGSGRPQRRSLHRADRPGGARSNEDCRRRTTTAITYGPRQPWVGRCSWRRPQATLRRCACWRTWSPSSTVPQGRIHLRNDVGVVDDMTLETRSTRTVRARPPDEALDLVPAPT